MLSGPVLVTGGAGFIGSNFVRMLVGDGVPVINLDALTYAGNPANLEGLPEDLHTLVPGSINDGGLVRALLSRHRPAAIVNFAAESHVDRSIDAPSIFIETNINGTFEMLGAALDWWSALEGREKDQFRFLHVSTDEVYGSIGEGAFTEDSAYAPNSPYAASKASADHLVRAFNRTWGLPTLVTNCGNNYGPYQFPEKFVPLMIINGLEGRPLPVYGDGSNVRDWIHVEDHCRGLRRVLEAGAPGETYNLGGAEGERSNLDVVETLCGVLDEKGPGPDGKAHRDLLSFVKDRPGHDFRYAIDAGKARRELGWEAETGFQSGIRGTVDWYVENRAWWEAIRAGTYGGQRLGLDRPGAGSKE